MDRAMNRNEKWAYVRGGLMIRKAVMEDVGAIEETYNEHFLHEQEHGAFTVFQKGVYPTKKDAEKAVNAGTLYVYEENGMIAGSVIVDRIQPKEYEGIAWGQRLEKDEVMVIHLLMVRPGMAGRGIASSLVKYAVETAKANACRAVRLDTGKQNLPAVSLYQKLGFRVAAAASMKVGSALEHSGHLFLEKAL